MTSTTSATVVMDSGYRLIVTALGGSYDRMSSFSLSIPLSAFNRTVGLLGTWDLIRANDLADISGRNWSITYPNFHCYIRSIVFCVFVSCEYCL